MIGAARLAPDRLIVFAAHAVSMSEVPLSIAVEWHVKIRGRENLTSWPTVV